MKQRRLTVVQRGQGERLNIGSHTAVAGTADSLNGAYCVFDQRLEPQRIAAVHSHADEDQVAWVQSGTLTVWVDGDQEEVGAGGFALRPAGLPHAMWNATDEPVRFLEITSPATRFETYMRELSALIGRGESNPERVARLAGSYGIEFYPELTEQLVAETNLTTRGGFWKDE
jgi:mannose-6-phosphate isomerase-like protein (cupin superfamily)